MGKKMKLKIEELKVESFVVVNKKELNDVKGGKPLIETLICSQGCAPCDNV